MTRTPTSAVRVTRGRSRIARHPERSAQAKHPGVVRARDAAARARCLDRLQKAQCGLPDSAQRPLLPPRTAVRTGGDRARKQGTGSRHLAPVGEVAALAWACAEPTVSAGALATRALVVALGIELASRTIRSNKTRQGSAYSVASNRRVTQAPGSHPCGRPG